MNELSPPVDKPITVNSSALPEQFSQALRVALVAIGGYMVGKGWLNADLVSAIVPVILLGVPLVWGQIVAKRNNAVKVTLADNLPDRIAKVQ